jgi:3-deoxy-D-manno-octulosonic-acid transferase
MRTAYSLLLYLATPFVLLYFAARGLKDKRYAERWSERFGFVPAGLQQGGILLHAASVGEVNAARELIISLSHDYPDLPLTVSTLTPTGSAQVRRLLGDSVGHCFIPLDVPGAVRRFLTRLDPVLIIVIETEIWPNLYLGAQSRDIPLVMANARLSERSLSRYRVAGEFVARALNRVAWIGAQSADDHRRLVECGADADAVRMTGNLKFDLDVPHNLAERGSSLRNAWGNARKVIVAGSTHEEDEVVVIPAFLDVLHEYPDALLVLAPRHPERFSRVAQAAVDAGLKTELYSQGEACSPQAQCFVIDTVGELLTYYACGDVAYVGGGMGDQGGHNALEPAALGVPVLVGPNMFNAREIADQLLACQAARQVGDAQELSAAVRQILGDNGLRERMGRAGPTLVAANRGALGATLAAVGRLL